MNQHTNIDELPHDEITELARTNPEALVRQIHSTYLTTDLTTSAIGASGLQAILTRDTNTARLASDAYTALARQDMGDHRIFFTRAHEDMTTLAATYELIAQLTERLQAELNRASELVRANGDWNTPTPGSGEGGQDIGVHGP